MKRCKLHVWIFTYWAMVESGCIKGGRDVLGYFCIKCRKRRHVNPHFNDKFCKNNRHLIKCAGERIDKYRQYS